MLMRFDPYRELDRLTEQLASTASRAPRAFPMDAYRRGEQFIVQFDLPGVEPAAIDLTVEQNVLTVRAERRFEPRQDDEVVVAERPHGTYTRQIFSRRHARLRKHAGQLRARRAHAHDPGRRDSQAAPRAGRREFGRPDDRADRDELSCRSSSACSTGAGVAACGTGRAPRA